MFDLEAFKFIIWREGLHKMLYVVLFIERIDLSSLLIFKAKYNISNKMHFLDSVLMCLQLFQNLMYLDLLLIWVILLLTPSLDWIVFSWQVFFSLADLEPYQYGLTLSKVYINFWFQKNKGVFVVEIKICLHFLLLICLSEHIHYTDVSRQKASVSGIYHFIQRLHKKNIFSIKDCSFPWQSHLAEV